MMCSIDIFTIWHYIDGYNRLTMNRETTSMRLGEVIREFEQPAPNQVEIPDEKVVPSKPLQEPVPA